VIELDWDSKIDPNLAHSLTQIGERTFWIFAGIADDNVVASPKHHLVQAEIFEMPAIGEINLGIGAFVKPNASAMIGPTLKFG